MNKEKLNIIANQVYSIDHKYVNNIYWTGNISLSHAIYIFFQSYIYVQYTYIIYIVNFDSKDNERTYVSIICAYNIYIYTYTFET